MHATYETLRTSRVDGVMRVLIDHPPLNLLDHAMMRDLDELGLAMEGDRSISVIVFASANPDFFIAHADLRMYVDGADGPPHRQRKTQSLHEVLARIENLPQTTIACLDGRAIGGGAEILMCFDMRFAGRDRTRLGFFEVALGAIPGAGGTQRLPRLTGTARALELVLGCEEIDADTAASYGLVNRALPSPELETFVARLADRIACFPREALIEAKRAVRMAATTDFNQGIAFEAAAQRNAMAARAGQPSLIGRLLGLGGQTADFELSDKAESLARLSALTTTKTGKDYEQK